MGSVEGDELRHDQSGFSEKQLEPYLQEAMDHLIDRLFAGKSVGRLHLDAYVEKFAEEVAASIFAYKKGSITVATMSDLLATLEYLIRRELEGADELHEMAEELAQGES